MVGEVDAEVFSRYTIRMAIRKVTVNNFKRFGSQTFELSDSILLAGPNNSGKTTLLQAIATWKFGLDKWLSQRQSGSKGSKRIGVQITRPEFTVFPLKEMNLMWTGRSPGEGNRTKIEICVEGESFDSDNLWRCDLEFQYATPESIYIRPRNAKALSTDEINAFPPEEAKELKIVYVPPLTGVRWDESRQDEGLQNLHLGQGSPGEILKNILLDVTKNRNNWEEFKDHIYHLFGIDILEPKYDYTQPYISCEYKEKGKNRPLDLSNIGSGTLQVMLVLGILYARSTSVILLDEPDARQHVILQSQVYDTLSEIAKERSAQLIIATHSEELLNSTIPSDVMAFISENPKRLKSKTELHQVREVMKRINTMDFLLAEEIGSILYVEGESDKRILSKWSKTLKDEHPSWKFFKHPYIFPLGSCNLSEAREHFFALRLAFPELNGICLIDRNSKDLIEPRQEKNGLWVMSWQRYEIENYLLHRDVICRFVYDSRYGKQKITNRNTNDPEMLASSLNVEIDEVMKVLGYDVSSDTQDFGYRPAFEGVKASDGILIPLLNSLGQKITKSELHRLASVMKSDEIHQDVKEMLDNIVKIFELGMV